MLDDLLFNAFFIKDYHSFLTDAYYEIMTCVCKNLWTFRSSHRRCSVKKGVLTNFITFAGKHLRQSLFFDKVAGLSPATLTKKRLRDKCFLVNFVRNFYENLFYRIRLGDCFLTSNINDKPELNLELMALFFDGSTNPDL